MQFRCYYFRNAWLGCVMIPKVRSGADIRVSIAGEGLQYTCNGAWRPPFKTFGRLACHTICPDHLRSLRRKYRKSIFANKLRYQKKSILFFNTQHFSSTKELRVPPGRCGDVSLLHSLNFDQQKGQKTTNNSIIFLRGLNPQTDHGHPMSIYFRIFSFHGPL